MTADEQSNAYLDQVVKKQARLETDLKSRRAPMPVANPAPTSIVRAERREDADNRVEFAAVPQPVGPASNAVEVRVTGFGRWKNVVVPPNAFVVHTRRGHSAPLHVGLGVSFRYRP